MNGEPETFVPKNYDSPKTRHCEMLLSVNLDMMFVQGCCERILEDKDVEIGEGKPKIGEDPTYMRALWDAALVTLFKHAGEGGHKHIKEIYRKIIDSGGVEGKLIYEEWRNERNKRVSHPIGHGEVHEIGIALPPAVDKPDIITLQSQKVSASGKDAKLLMEMAKAIKCNINSELDIAFTELRKEVRALPLKKLQALPDLSIQPARGSKRPLGR